MPGLPRESARKALLIGCQYTANLKQYKQDLRGTHKDPFALRDLLINVYGYKREDINILIDDTKKQYVWPTYDNVVAAMRQLVANAKPGDHFVFSFSGHGAQIVNEDGTEEDGYDETLITVDTTYDSETETFSTWIKDDLVRSILVDSMPPGAQMVMIFDCCHSGTASDLPTVFMDGLASPCSPISSPRQFGTKGFGRMPSGSSDWESFSWMKSRTRSRHNSLPLESPIANVTSWSACQDSQVTFGCRQGGLFITAFTAALWKDPHQQHAHLLQSIREELANEVAKQNDKQRRKAKGKLTTDSLVSPKAQLSSLKNATALYHVPFAF